MILSSHAVLFGLVVVLFVAVLAGLAFHFIRRSQGVAATPDVETFLRRLTVVDRDKLDQVAMPLTAQEEDTPAELEGWQIWELVGGMEGLSALSKNCEVLIDMVCYIQHWYPEALPVAEQLRLYAREIQWHVERLRGAEARGHLRATFPDYAQRAVAIYCMVTSHVVALYEACQMPGLQEVRAAL